MRINNGAPFKAFITEIGGFCKNNRNHQTLGNHVQTLSVAVERLSEVATEMSVAAKADPRQWASYTYPALLCFGDVILAWRLLDMALIAHNVIDAGGESEFYLGKIMQATYFTGTTLPLTMARMDTCLRKGREIDEMPELAF
jgi:hypothetical protein